LILVVADGGGGGRVEDKDEDDSRTKIGLSPVELSDALTPGYGVREMLQCIRSAQEIGNN
jgi:hypothetical protein